MKLHQLAAPLCLAALIAGPLTAEESASTTRESPWMLVPQVSNGPKLGFSIGALAGYLHKFDEESPDSLFALTGSYSDTHSFVTGAFGRAHFDEDRQRIFGMAMFARANNEYNDFQNTGQTVSVENDLRMLFFQYQHQLRESKWYFGPTYVNTNYNPSGLNDFSQGILDGLDFSQEINAGLGIILSYDSLDNKQNPHSGQMLDVYVTGYSEAFGGDNNFFSYNGLYSYFIPLQEKWVIALNTSILATPDAPKASQATLRRFRAYTSGAVSAEYAYVAQVEARYSLTERWVAAAFGGTAAVVNGFDDMSDSENWYPMGGLGVRYILKDAGVVIRMDYAVGKDDNQAFYLKMGQPF